MEPQEFSRRLRELQSQLLYTTVSYQVYFGIWPTKEVVDVLNRHKGFFIPIRDALYQTMMMGLAKVFDKDSRTMSLRNLLHLAHQQMELVPNLTTKDIEEMNDRLSQHESAIEILKQMRNQQLAHLDANPEPLSSLQKGEVDRLIDTIEEVFNKLSTGHDGNFYSWSFQKERSAAQTDVILSILREKMETQRVENQRYLAELETDKMPD